jgi:hypothetical protein
MGNEQQQTARPTDGHLPTWVSVVVVAVKEWGAITVIALFLVWHVTSGANAELKAQAHKIEAHAAESRDALTRQLTVLSQICSNTASTSEERAACWRAVR